MRSGLCLAIDNKYSLCNLLHGLIVILVCGVDVFFGSKPVYSFVLGVVKEVRRTVGIEEVEAYVADFALFSSSVLIGAAILIVLCAAHCLADILNVNRQVANVYIVVTPPFSVSSEEQALNMNAASANGISLILFMFFICLKM